METTSVGRTPIVAGLIFALVLLGGVFSLRAEEPTPPSDAELTDVESVPPSTIAAGPKVEWDLYETRVRDWALDLGLANLSVDQLEDAMWVVDTAAMDVIDGGNFEANAELGLRTTVLCWHLPADHGWRDGEFCDRAPPPAAMFVPGYSRGVPSPEDYDEYTEVYP